VIAQEAQKDVADFAGADMELGGDQGLYERGLSQLEADLSATLRSAYGQREIWQTTLGTLQDTQRNLADTMGEIAPHVPGRKSFDPFAADAPRQTYFNNPETSGNPFGHWIEDIFG
jgi:hypothetical protein